MAIERSGEGEVMSQVTVNGGVAYLAGQVAMQDRGEPTEKQAVAIFTQIDALLASVGSDRSRLLSATIYLTDIGDFAEMNAAWAAWLGDGPRPARTTVGGVALALSGLTIEITVIAAI